MPTYATSLKVETSGDGDIHDLTGELRGAVEDSEIRSGTATAFVPGSTAGITTIEFEPGLVRDTAEALERLAPRNIDYGHNRGGETNGHAHIRASLIGPGVTVPLIDGKLALGTWQQVVLIDCDDRPRRREVVLQIVGDGGS